jgi:DNA-binding Lrp family transcriptional regulator
VAEAYVLIEAEIGKPSRVAEQLVDIPGVSVVHVLTGPYDLIIRIEADDVDGLGKLVLNKIQAVEGLSRTLTCPVVQL